MQLFRAGAGIGIVAVIQLLLAADDSSLEIAAASICGMAIGRCVLAILLGASQQPSPPVARRCSSQSLNEYLLGKY